MLDFYHIASDSWSSSSSLQVGKASIWTEAQGRAASSSSCTGQLNRTSSEQLIAGGSNFGQDTDWRKCPGFGPDSIQSPQEEPWPRDRLQLWWCDRISPWRVKVRLLVHGEPLSYRSLATVNERTLRLRIGWTLVSSPISKAGLGLIPGTDFSCGVAGGRRTLMGWRALSNAWRTTVFTDSWPQRIERTPLLQIGR